MAKELVNIEMFVQFHSKDYNVYQATVSMPIGATNEAIVAGMKGMVDALYADARGKWLQAAADEEKARAPMVVAKKAEG